MKEMVRTEPGRHFVRVDGRDVAAMAYSVMADGAYLVEHTAVLPGYQGRGYAEALLESLAGEARRKGVKIVPDCSFVRGQFERYPEKYGDVMG